MEKIAYIDLDKMQKHPQNPRYIKDDAFNKLVVSIKKDPKYFEVRPIILSDRTGTPIIIAGNQRFEAAKTLGWKNAPATIRKGLTEEEELEILFKDNGSYGAFDWDVITNNGWDDLLKDNDWGVDLPLEISTEQLPKKMSHSGEPSDPLQPEFRLEIKCTSEEQLDDLFKELSERGFTCTTNII